MTLIITSFLQIFSLVHFNIHPNSRLGTQHRSYYESLLPYITLTGIIRDIRITTLVIFNIYMLVKLLSFIFLYAKSLKD